MALQWQPSTTQKTLKYRAEFLAKIRSFFAERKVMEVETSLLSHGTVTDVHLEAFQCHFDHTSSGEREALYLQTSPEFAMKRLLASGSGCIYQMCKAFRHEAQGRYHNPEFTMLEWYRVGFDMHQLIDEVDALLQHLLSVLPCRRLSYRDAFLQYLSIDIFEVSVSELKAEIEKQGLAGDWLEQETSIDTLLQFLFSMCIEPKLVGDNATCIYHFPATQASLARINNDDPRLSERFEFYHQGVELANGFHELSNAQEQRQRFVADNLTRKQMSIDEKPIDERFLAALSQGLPDCAGVALGVDRLLMLATDAKTITEVIPFTTESS